MYVPTCTCRFNAQGPRHQQQDQSRDSSHRGHYELAITETQAKTTQFRRRVDAGSKYLLVGTSQCARFTPAEPPSNGGASCHLFNSGHSVVWNRIAIKCHKFQEAGAKVAETPSDVIKMTDVTLACLSDPQVAKDLLFGTCGVMSVKLVGKVYVECPTSTRKHRRTSPTRLSPKEAGSWKHKFKARRTRPRRTC
ncbi:uncharacterized protein LOC6042030 isoform X2 [Culex quinquefasciatus]|uniref:uncharacterized protein LOC6042030 isoform X2 n=1 Tax=Culex quinquefasciatus TaxID=7176 RepID=UPI0018E2F4DA|nr:uncharacterized protein LOC6042030 isoform X2 [Culex quinquefasciatus]